MVGVRKSRIDFNGTNIKIVTNVGKVGWQGVESYEETTYFLSAPATFGGSVSLWNVTISADVGGRIIGQSGSIAVGKNGPVGPFFGESGYFGIGVTSDRDITSIQVWPVIRLGIEWNPLKQVSMMGNWQPKIGEYPQQISGGVGWQFLKTRIP